MEEVGKGKSLGGGADNVGLVQRCVRSVSGHVLASLKGEARKRTNLGCF